MSSSAWGRILDDTVGRIMAITPTVEPKQRWRHVPDSRASGDDQQRSLGGGSPRQFTSLDIDRADDAGVAGAGERQEDWTVTLRVSYLPSQGVHDMVASDFDDLVKALQATGTYPSGSWGALKVRRVGPPEGPEHGDDGEMIARFPVRCIFRRSVTLL